MVRLVIMMFPFGFCLANSNGECAVNGFLRGSMMVDAKQRARRALGVPRRAEHAAFEPVERAVGGEEREAANVTGLVARDDAGGAVMNFDDVGFGHDASFAAIAARVQKL
jgi:hypothetical protein